jgi:hypothetical protein
MNNNITSAILSLSICLPLASAHAIDIAPYKVGQKLDASQAKELQHRYRQREKQAWKKPESIDALKGHKDAE